MRPGDTIFVPEKIIGGSTVWQNIAAVAQAMSVAALPLAISGSFSGIPEFLNPLLQPDHSDVFTDKSASVTKTGNSLPRQRSTPGLSSL